MSTLRKVFWRSVWWIARPSMAGFFLGCLIGLLMPGRRTKEWLLGCGAGAVLLLLLCVLGGWMEVRREKRVSSIDSGGEQ